MRGRWCETFWDSFGVEGEDTGVLGWVVSGRKIMAGGEDERGWCSPLYLLNLCLHECITYSKRNGEKWRNKGGIWGYTSLPWWAGQVVKGTHVGVIIFLSRLGGRGSWDGLAYPQPLLWATWHLYPKSFFLISTKGSIAYKFKTQTQLYHCQLCDLGPFNLFVTQFPHL